MVPLHVQLQNSTLRGVIRRLHFPLEIMLVCVRWYAAYPLSLRHLEEMMAERGVLVDHATVHRWALKMLPVTAKVFRRRKHQVGRSWRVDETYIQVGGQWKYLYRAVDRFGQTVDFRFCRNKAGSHNEAMVPLHVQLQNSTLRGVIRRLHFPLEIMLVCVRWYAAYPLSLRHLEEMMAERGVLVDHATVHRWALKMLPVMAKVFRRRKHQVGRSWRVDETYIQVGGQWKYLYRAVDRFGQTVDFLLTARRDEAAARRFFERAFDQHDVPEKITIDKSGANTAAVRGLIADSGLDIGLRQSKYLNNVVEQDHRAIKRRVRPMMGFKSFSSAARLIAGIELMHMIKKGQLRCPGGLAFSHADYFYSLATR